MRISGRGAFLAEGTARAKTLSGGCLIQEGQGKAWLEQKDGGGRQEMRGRENGVGAGVVTQRLAGKEPGCD